MNNREKYRYYINDNNIVDLAKVSAIRLEGSNKGEYSYLLVVEGHLLSIWGNDLMDQFKRFVGIQDDLEPVHRVKLVPVNGEYLQIVNEEELIWNSHSRMWTSGEFNTSANMFYESIAKSIIDLEGFELRGESDD